MLWIVEISYQKGFFGFSCFYAVFLDLPVATPAIVVVRKDTVSPSRLICLMPFIWYVAVVST